MTRDHLFCQRCRHKQAKRKVAAKTKQRKKVNFRIVSEKIDIKEEIKGLRFLENKYPEILEKIRARTAIKIEENKIEKLINKDAIHNKVEVDKMSEEKAYVENNEEYVKEKISADGSYSCIVPLIGKVEL